MNTLYIPVSQSVSVSVNEGKGDYQTDAMDLTTNKPPDLQFHLVVFAVK